MRGFLFIPIALIATAGAGVLLCRLMGVNPQLAAMAAAAVGSLFGSALAAIPLLLNSSSSQADTAQAGLISTTVHLFAHAAVAAIVILGHLRIGNGFVYWLMSFYMVSLVIVCGSLVAMIRRSPTQQAHSSGSDKQ